MLNIDIDTARRFILGKQGLWPGRRGQGLEGTEQALRTMEYLQLDPLQILARSQDIALHSRVLGYTPGLWEEVAYQQRKFFDWGGWLALRSMDELPHWRVVMSREQETTARLREIGQEHSEAIVEMRDLLHERSTVSNRDFATAKRTRTSDYRGGKDSALALYYLWRTGEVMTHHRANFERVYALTERVAPAELIHETEAVEADRFLILKEISFLGLSRLQRTSDAFRRGVPFERKKLLLEALLAEGEIIQVQVEGWKFTHFALASDAPMLEALIAGRVPQEWRPLETTTSEEAVFLAPLDPVCARGRAKDLFGFEYVWEVYKPKNKRKFGYYALPILWGDQLVGRFDSKLDRERNIFVILGLWLEAESLRENEDFAEALARGFKRFVTFLGASGLDAQAVGEPRLRARIASAIEAK